MTGSTKTMVKPARIKTANPPKAAPKAEAQQPLTVASNDELLSMLASINQLLKLQLKLSGFNLTVTEALIL
jgi:hypothetical protein